jgi:hypothetical protein
LHNKAIVATHRVDHQLERWVDNRARLLRVEVLHQLGRALDVSEQGRHDLALTVSYVRRGLFGQRANRDRR